MTPATTCRACGAAALESFYRLSGVPVHSCILLRSRDEALAFPRGDIDLQLCGACGFIQNGRFDEERLSYAGDYEETQAYSPRFRRFLDALCADQAGRHALAGKTLLEIGCGKGEYLATLCEKAPGATGYGIDPSCRPERVPPAARERIAFVRERFGPAHAGIAADYVCCRHTLEHIPDVGDFMRVVRSGIGQRDDVVVFFDLPDMRRVLAEGAFWDIYHEHCSYFTAGSLRRLFRQTGFEVTRLWRDYDDQFLMIEARPAPPGARERPDAGEPSEERELVGLFRRTASARLAALRDTFGRGRARGETVVLWGSGSKAVALLTTLGLGPEVAGVVDVNPHKHGCFMAGTGHEIVAPESLVALRPDRVVVMNVIYRQEIGETLDRLGLAPAIEVV